MAGLDPAIHDSGSAAVACFVDGRVEPGHDVEETEEF
jgi:hypothetical protein